MVNLEKKGRSVIASNPFACDEVPCFYEALDLIQPALPNGKSDPAWFDQLPSCRFFLFNLTLIKKKIEMIHRYYAPVQLLALSPILYLTVQKRTPASAGPLKVRSPIWSNRSNRPKTGPDGCRKTTLRTTRLRCRAGLQAAANKNFKK